MDCIYCMYQVRGLLGHSTNTWRFDTLTNLRHTMVVFIQPIVPLDANNCRKEKNNTRYKDSRNTRDSARHALVSERLSTRSRQFGRWHQSVATVQISSATRIFFKKEKNLLKKTCIFLLNIWMSRDYWLISKEKYRR